MNILSLPKKLIVGAAFVAFVAPAGPAVAQATQADPVEALVERFSADVPIARQLKALPKAEREQLRGQFAALSDAQKSTLRQRLGARRSPASATQEQGRGPANPTIQYDTGTPYVFRVPTGLPLSPPPGTRGTAGSPGAYVGNYFTSGFGDPHTITGVQFQMNGLYYSTFTGTHVGQVIVGGAPNPGGTASILANSFVYPTPGVLYDVNFTGSGSNTLNLQGLSGPFVAVAWQSANATGTPYEPNTTVNNIAVDVNSLASPARGNGGFHGISFTSTYVADGGTESRGAIGQLYGANLSPTVPDTTSVPGGGVRGAPYPNPAVRLPFNAILRVTGPSLPVELMSFDVE